MHDVENSSASYSSSSSSLATRRSKSNKDISPPAPGMNTSRIRFASTSTLLRRRVFYTVDRSKPVRHRANRRSDCSLAYSHANQPASYQFPPSSSYHPFVTMMVSSARSKLQSLPICRPFLTQLAVSTVKTTAADILVQTVAEKKSWKDIDWRRTTIFAGFGFAYLGCFQWYLLINKYSKWFPTMKHFASLPLREKLRCKQGLAEGVKMVVFDVVVHSPMIYFPSYYTLKEFVGGSSWNPKDWVKDGLRKYYHNAAQDLSAMVIVTIPSGE